MKSYYKKLGIYIRQVGTRNRDMKVTDLQGISINKEFMPSVANVIGTDLSVYRVVSRNQFAFNPMHVGRDEVLPINMLSNKDAVIVSPAYIVFEIKDTNILDPEYLMMWFRRPEFDREAWFTTDSSVRGGFNWKDFCDMELPIPSIEKQREIVTEYGVLINRINLNNTLIEKLEDTAQALYKQWFVDFEFPNSEGNPYKSSGGEMKYSKELEKEVPREWKVSSLANIANYMNGLAMQNYESNGNEDSLPVIKIRELNLGKTDETSGKAKTNIPKNYIIENGDVIFSWSGSLIIDIWSGGIGGLNQHLFKITSKTYPKWFYYWWTKYHLAEFIKIADGNKTSMGHIKREHLDGAKVLVPDDTIFIILNRFMSILFDKIILKKLERRKTQDIKDLILAKMTSVG